jgi:hypothetical protein
VAYFIALTLKHNNRVIYLRKQSIKRVTPRDDGDYCEILQDGAPSPVEVAEDDSTIMFQLEEQDA